MSAVDGAAAATAQTATDDGKLARVRAQLPSVLRRHYFNAGRHGPIPIPVADVLQAELRAEVEMGRGSMPARDIEKALDDVRRRVESLLGAPQGSVALTHNATEGVNVAVGSVRWRDGDELVTLTTEHPSALAPLEAATLRHGVTVRRVDPDPEPRRAAEQIVDAIGERTRLVMVSHVSWATGATLPLRALADACHSRGALLVVDGAQSAGSIPIDVVADDVDFYAIPGQKWLCGPSGTGALYVRRELVDDALPGVAGWASIEDLDPISGRCDWWDDARRFEGSSESVPLRVAFGAALRWLGDDLGFDWVHARIRDGVRQGRALLEDVRGVGLVTPPGDHAGLLCFAVDGLDPDSVVFRLARRGVVVRTVIHPRCVRACIGFYNDDADLLALRDALRDATTG
jgi:L-cysteine/cystine lyase